MLWQKSWWETRWSLVPIMGVILVFAALNQRLDQADLDKWILELQKRAPAWSEDSRRLLPLLSSYQGYVWYYWFRLIMLTLWPTVALGMGATTLLHSSCPWTGSGAGIFTFSLPVSRRRILLTHVALVALEMVLLALLSSLMIPMASSMFGTDCSFRERGDPCTVALARRDGFSGSFFFADGCIHQSIESVVHRNCPDLRPVLPILHV